MLDLQPSDTPGLGNIPWGYGENRVTAVARDPSWLFIYWELTDEAIAQARSEVQAPDADCILRVYDTTYRLFDGTNANWLMDVPIHRPANNHYVLVNRPAATFHVDIGVKSAKGQFATIARSVPVETPRDSFSPVTSVEWMTVAPSESPPPEYQHRFRAGTGVTAPAPAEAFGTAEGARSMPSLVGERWSRREWSATDVVRRAVRWARSIDHVDRNGRVEIVFEGERRVIQLERGERVVLGPWHVTIRGISPDGGHRVIDRWTIHYSWVTEAGMVRIETASILQRILHGYHAMLVPSGSEARLIRESWASEGLQLGASEWRWIGGSESWLVGASETLYAAASELRYLGASETLSLGASETRYLGASEARSLGGASEILFAGASEFLGASERFGPGASGPAPPRAWEGQP